MVVRRRAVRAWLGGDSAHGVLVAGRAGLQSSSNRKFGAEPWTRLLRPRRAAMMAGRPKCPAVS